MSWFWKERPWSLPFAKPSILNVWQRPEYVYLSMTAQQFVRWLYVCAASDTFGILAHAALCFFLVYAGIVNHIRHYQGIFTHIETLLKDIQAYVAKFSTYITLTYLKLAIFWTLASLELEAWLKPCENLTRYIQNSAIGHYSTIFRHIQNLAQLLHMQKPGILRILEYWKLFHNCFPTHIQNPSIFTKI